MASARARERASIEARRELGASSEDMPLTDAAHVRLSMVEFFSYPFKNPVEYLDAADRIIRAAVEFGVSTRAFLGMLIQGR